mgnify:CR=1 FL=1
MTDSPATAKIAVAAATYWVDRPFDYRIPPALADKVVPGVRVVVPFGGGNRRTEGIVLSLGTAQPGMRLKSIASVLDASPVLSPEMIRLAVWLRERYFCTVYDAVHAMLPAGLWYQMESVYTLCAGFDRESAYAAAGKSAQEQLVLDAVFAHGGSCPLVDLERLFENVSPARALQSLVRKGVLETDSREKRRVGDKKIRMVSLTVSAEDAQVAADRREKRAPLQSACLRLLCTLDRVSFSELCYFTGASSSSVNALVKAGLAEITQDEVFRRSVLRSEEQSPLPELNEEQRAAFEGILSLYDGEHASASLLNGVTGSGKTSVYVHLIDAMRRKGKASILLVPEIALTPQMMAKFTAYFGENVAMLHSGLQLTERYDQWKRIRRGDVRVVLGTRSAVFAPLPDLGLIIMDEEQEPTYCSENPPRYHTRDVAQFRCAQSGALLLLGSATPTVETMYYAREGRYQVFPLYRRYNEKALPEVFIADLRDELRAGNETAVSEPLRSALEENLARGEQSILFLNRRGSSRMLLCGECGEVPECPRCSVPMTYHSANGRLMCHYCGHSEPAYERCPQCGGIMKHIGTGTQKVEEELHALFPGAKVLRMDTDTVGASHGHEKLLRQFEEEKIPILLGTQMVAKGLDFENVTLVGVLCADASLYIDNYRAPERTFSLLSQVVGRAGRGSKQGRAIIQTFTPENEVIRAAAAQDYDVFYESEIRMRRLRRYPPFADLFSFTVTGADESRVIGAAKALRDALGYAVERREELKPLSIEVLGPAGASVVKVNNRYRYRVFLVGKGCPALRRLVAEYLYAFYQHKENRGLDIFADCNAIQ